MKKGPLNKFTCQIKDGRADFERRRTRTTPKDKDRNEEGDVKTLITINMIAGRLEPYRDEQKRGRQAYKEANIMAVEALFWHSINFELEADNKVAFPHFNPLVISTRVNRFVIKQILLNTGSFVNLITLEIFDKLDWTRRTFQGFPTS